MEKFYDGLARERNLSRPGKLPLPTFCRKILAQIIILQVSTYYYYYTPMDKYISYDFLWFLLETVMAGGGGGGGGGLGYPHDSWKKCLLFCFHILFL